MSLQPTILYEDVHMVVLNKPAGMIVNNADTTKGEETLQDWIEGKFPKEEKDGSDFYNRAGIVHRLDKETSGIILVAKTPEAFIELQRQFKERIVKKTYIALAHGKVFPEGGTINVPVGRLPWNRMQFGVVAGGRDSVTRYRVISNLQFPISNEQMTLLELYPETGRTHQIRVHLKHIGFPIFSDPLYGGRKQARADRKVLNRVFLHAAKILFLHPSTQKEISIESPMPDELQKVLNS